MVEAEILPDGQDPRRTKIGNRIDPRLAKGFVSQMFEIADRQLKISADQKIGHLTNIKARMRVLSKLKKKYGKAFILAVASPDYIKAEIAILQARAINGERLIGACALRFDFRDQCSIPASHWSSYPLQNLGTCALLTEHAMIRMAQRGGARSFDEFLNLIKPFWAWASVAHEVSIATQQDFHWFMPVSSGLFAIRTYFFTAPSENPVIVSTAKTYIDCADMRPFNKEIWLRLTGMGGLDVVPRFPRLSPPSQEQIDFLAAMILAGTEWQNRLVYAVTKRPENEPDPFQ